MWLRRSVKFAAFPLVLFLIGIDMQGLRFALESISWVSVLALVIAVIGAGVCFWDWKDSRDVKLVHEHTNKTAKQRDRDRFNNRVRGIKWLRQHRFIDNESIEIANETLSARLAYPTTRRDRFIVWFRGRVFVRFANWRIYNKRVIPKCMVYWIAEQLGMRTNRH